MEFEATALKGVVKILNRRFGDDRGYFMESYHAEKFAKAGIYASFEQDNHSRSEKGVLRGLHLQYPKWQGKLVRCISGSIFDVAVDVRPQSPQFGQWMGMELTGENNIQLYVPEGFAHGFVVTSDTADVIYKCTDVYRPQDEVSIRWDDEDIGIDWPIEPQLVQLSAKDADAISLADWRDRHPDGVVVD